MWSLHKQSSYNELVAYANLCWEFRVRRVSLDAETFSRVKFLSGCLPSEPTEFMGIRFIKKSEFVFSKV